MDIWPAIAAGVVGTIFAIMMIVYMDRMRSTRAKYSEKLHRFELDLLREQLERQRAELEKRLAATSEKWQEMYQHVVSGQRTLGSDFEIRPIPNADFVRSLGIEPSNISVDRSLILVLMPFHSDYVSTFETIRETCSSVGMRCVRGDESNVHGEILRHVVKLMCQARLVIAVIQDRNPNVFYELGIAHALDKNVLLLTKNIDEVPFDLRGRLLLFYNNDQSLRKELLEALTKITLHG